MCQALAKHFACAHPPTHAILLGGYYLDPILQMSKRRHSEHSLNARYGYHSEAPRSLCLCVPAAHRAADERVAVTSKEQRLGFEEETGHPVPGGQRSLPQPQPQQGRLEDKTAAMSG